MAARSQEEAENDLEDLFDTFREALSAGVSYFWTANERDAHRITKGVRAGMIRCYVADELKKRVDGRPGIKILENTQTIMFAVRRKYEWILKIHKLDEDCLAAMNMGSQASLDFNNNDLHMAEIPGLEGPTVVFLGYTEVVGDRFSPQMRLVCPEGTVPAWVIDLGYGTMPPQVEIGPSDSPKSDSGTQVVVRRKDRKASH